ncbi:MAG: hypothetical protein QOJ11_1205 [Frankiales bacterium]|nr:hypothetical protein [Frankiales bacterium]
MNQPQDGTHQAPAALPSSALVAALVDPLLDARAQPAAERFDRLVAGALSDGVISQELARELRFWQRAAVHEIADHVRTVLPAVLPVALAVVAASSSEAVAAVASATATWQGREAQPEADAQPAEVDPRAVAPAEVVVSAPDAVVVDDPVGQPLESTNPHLRRRLFVAGLTSIA